MGEQVNHGEVGALFERGEHLRKRVGHRTQHDNADARRDGRDKLRGVVDRTVDEGDFTRTARQGPRCRVWGAHASGAETIRPHVGSLWDGELALVR